MIRCVRLVSKKSVSLLYNKQIPLVLFSHVRPKTILNKEEIQEINQTAKEYTNTYRALQGNTIATAHGKSAEDRLIESLYNDVTAKGEATIDLNNLDSITRNKVMSAFQEFSDAHTNHNEFEDQFMKELDNMLKSHPETEEMSPDELLDFLKLKPEEKKFISDNLKESVNKVEKAMESVDLQQLFPDAKDSISDFTNAMQKAVSVDPSLQNDINKWLQQVHDKVGSNVQDLEKLSDEEFAEIALPPKRLRVAMKPFMTTSSRLGDINLDMTNDPRDAFVMKK